MQLAAQAHVAERGGLGLRAEERPPRARGQELQGSAVTPNCCFWGSLGVVKGFL